MKHVLEGLTDDIKGQVVATTHNTFLMEELKAENVYIIRVDVNGMKTIECVSDYQKRTQKNNNIRKKYINGDYAGVPYPGEMDFDELFNEANSELGVEVVD